MKHEITSALAETHPTVAAIDLTLKDLEAALDAASGERARLALAAMTDKKALARLTDIEAELAGYAVGIERATAARRAAVDAAAAEHAGARAEALKQNVADALHAVRQRIDACKAIEKSIAALGAALEQHAALALLGSDSVHRAARLSGLPIDAAIALADQARGNEGSIRQQLFFMFDRAREVSGAAALAEFPGLSTTQPTPVAGAKEDLERLEYALGQLEAP
jgi:hypothetical protein